MRDIELRDARRTSRRAKAGALRERRERWSRLRLLVLKAMGDEWTQARVAKTIGLSLSHVARCFSGNGEKPPSQVTMDTLRDLFEIDEEA